MRLDSWESQSNGKQLSEGHRPSAHRAAKPRFRCQRLLVFPIHDPAIHDCHHDFGLFDLFGINLEDIIRDDYQVSELAWRNRAFYILLELSVRRSDCVGAYRFFYGNLLLGNPAVGILAIKCPPSHSRIDAQDWIKRSDGPVSAKREGCARVEQRPERVRRFRALLAYSVFRPATIVDGVIRL